MSNSNVGKKFSAFSEKQEVLSFLFILFIIFNYQNLLAEKPCGKILGGFNDDCIIIRKDGLQPIKPKVNMNLYDGDLIVQNSGIEHIYLNLSPFSKMSPIHLNAICIEYEPPENKNLLPKFLRWAKNLESAIHITQNALTRNITYEDIDPVKLYPQPGWRASLFPGESVIFRWDSRLAISFIIKDCQGRVLLRRKTNSETSIELNVDEIRMEPYSKYYWGIEIRGINEIRTDYELKLLDSDIAQIVEIGFADIEKEDLEPLYKKIKKAAYLQFISDLYGDNAELYWKSGQILAEIDKNELDNQYSNEYRLLLINFKDHHKIKSRRIQ